MPDIDQGVQSGSTNTGSSTGSAAPVSPGVAPGQATPGTPQQGSSGTQGTSGGQQSDSERNWQAVRQQLAELQGKYEPWEKTGLKPEQVTQYSGIYQKLYGEAAAVGRGLGYPDSEIADALAEDPIRTIDFLRDEAARMQQGGQDRDGSQDLQELVAQHVQQALGPIQERENVRMTDAANSLFERAAYQEISNIFQKEGFDVTKASIDETQFIMDAVSEVLKYEQGDIDALKFQGKTAGVQKAFQTAMNAIDKYYLARVARERGRLQPGGQGQQQQNAGQDQPYKPSLDDIINDPTALDRARGRTGDAMRYR